MQFTTILLSILASTAVINAAPVPEPVFGAIAGAIGLGCAFQADKCQKAGDEAIEVIKEGPKGSGSRQWEAAKDDGGFSIGAGKGGFTPGSFKE
ncbi:hypothetical protein TWF106_003579 [Orbilia oligospora]|uniref:Uncharacterized protein n=1 Tax=Orbilia oligospora TaxID=2813651 RepID=A0A6G1MKH6_ORBOL|nr:hypothetical protein TWF788_010328 [Orbilia oligospora]KAF3224610.1 hypothetical protein TWF106_003579 [Orbilia oligospora]KAF3261040.1 hypothetical protein TWF192_008973 [Orbilia oligospora]